MSKYTIRYGVLSSESISDKVLVINPAYGEPIGKFGSRPVRPSANLYNKLEGESNFFTKLTKSVLSEGFRNPIFCNSIEEGTFSRYGTCRLWVAKTNKLEIPAIIADFTGRWSHLEELFTEEDIAAKYKDIPAVIELNENDMRIDGCDHYHLNEEWTNRG